MGRCISEIELLLPASCLLSSQSLLNIGYRPAYRILMPLSLNLALE
jgi:hypothetical protein